MIHTSTYTVVCENHPKCSAYAKIDQDGYDIDFDSIEQELKNVHEWLCVDGEHYCHVCAANVLAEIAEAEEDERTMMAADYAARARDILL